MRSILRDLLQPLGGLAPEPLDVAVVGLVSGAETGPLDRDQGALVEPAFDLGVAVGEGETTGAVVVAGWPVAQQSIGKVWCRIHVGAEESVVHAIRVLVYEDPGV